MRLCQDKIFAIFRRFNHELMEFYRKPEINRLRLLGHVKMMDENHVPKRLLKTKPEFLEDRKTKH